MTAVEGRAEEVRWLFNRDRDLRPKSLIDTIRAPRLPVTVTLHCDEITTLDPRTRQPDFVTADITYRPRQRLIDSKGLHAYIVGLRGIGYSMERLATVLAKDIADASAPEWVEVTIREKPRGGIAITAVCRIAERVGFDYDD